MAHPIHHQPTIVTSASFYVALHAGVGGLSGWGFNLIHPIGGVVFGGVYAVTDVLSNKLLDYIFDNTEQGKCWKFALSFFASIATAAYLTTLAGYSFTFMSGVGLVIGMLAVMCGLQCLAWCCPSLGLQTNGKTI